MANGPQEISNNTVLTAAQRDAHVDRMKAAWANLPSETKAQLTPLLEKAHQQLGDFLDHRTPPTSDVDEILRVKSYLTDDWDRHVERLDGISPTQPRLDTALATQAIKVSIAPGGEILGTGRYQQLDPRWELVAGTVWLENLLHKHPFPPGMPKPVPIAEHVTIALLGDFGTGNFGANDSPSTKISKFVPTLKPDITIHLGDVYYAGTGGEETNNFLNFWPQGSFASFALNSNHEMYSGGGPYFNEAVGGKIFNKYQSPFSFFALENSNWIIVGLDSAYNAGVLTLYMDGSLGNDAQIPFLKGLAQKAETENKKVIVLTHHNGLPEDGVQPKTPLKLFTEVMGAFEGLTPPAYWYWGHVHAAAAYKPLADQNGLLCRCAGHAAIPWGVATTLQASQNVDWFEKCSANDPEDNVRVFNGFATLQLDGETLQETFYDELGRVAWTPQGGDPRHCAP
jgi:hypothetical protein